MKVLGTFSYTACGNTCTATLLWELMRVDTATQLQG
jgi:hypothetical protein